MNTTSGVATTLQASQISTTRRKWLTSVKPAAASYDLDEPAHVPHRLHRAAEPVDVAGGTRHEALPSVEAGPRRAEGERDREVVRAQGARGVGARVLGAVGDAL